MYFCGPMGPHLGPGYLFISLHFERPNRGKFTEIETADLR